MKLKGLLYFILVSCIFFLSCTKEPAQPTPVLTLLIEPSVINLAKDEPYGTRLTVNFINAEPGENLDIEWLSENPRIASVTSDGVVWPEGAGETYVVAKMRNGKAQARVKAIITDGYDYKYRIILKDKGQPLLSLNNPKAFLSAKAISRRAKRGIQIDENDLPISQEYLRQIRQIGGEVIAQSKWLKTISVHCQDQFLIDQYKALPFVEDVVLVWQGKRAGTPPAKNYIDSPKAGSSQTSGSPLQYGTAIDNITTNNGQYLHNNGYLGAGIDIAVIDAGFINLKNNQAFQNVNVKGAKSFVYENDDPYIVDEHGVWVLSCLAVNMPGQYIGTAPEANYWLFKTEDQSSEYPVEEDYWVSAAEYADSVGVDIINSSLYYTTGYAIAKYVYEDMDGKTAHASRAANIAAAKGILVVNCAGNEQSWVGTPADSPNVLTIGSVDRNLTASVFNSFGVTSDGRIKPDVMARGHGAAVINAQGVSEYRFGTSYAAPIISGLAACLWQAYPDLTNMQLIEIIRKSADRSNKPEIPYGYGVANMETAAKLAGSISKKNRSLKN